MRTIFPVDVLTDKSVALVLSALASSASGSMRYSQLARAIAGVSQKMLTQTLRSLERDGLITRTVTPSVPVRVDYQLAALGRDLQTVVVNLKRWAESHMDEVLAARQAYDRHTARAAAGTAGTPRSEQR